MIKFQIVTNNQLVKEKYENEYEINYFDVTYKEILLRVRSMCQEGYQLLTHPMSGSVKPNETPYKSIMLSTSKGNINEESLLLIEKCFVTYNKFEDLKKEWSKEVLEDFQLIDYTLISSGISSATTF